MKVTGNLPLSIVIEAVLRAIIEVIQGRKSRKKRKKKSKSWL